MKSTCKYALPPMRKSPYVIQNSFIMGNRACVTNSSTNSFGFLKYKADKTAFVDDLFVSVKVLNIFRKLAFTYIGAQLENFYM